MRRPQRSHCGGRRHRQRILGDDSSVAKRGCSDARLVLSCGTRRWTSTSCSSAAAARASLTLQVGRSRHGADRCHRTNRQQRAGAAEAAVHAADKPPRVALQILHSRSQTASFSAARQREHVRFSRVGGAVDPIGRLRSEFEVDLPLRNRYDVRYKNMVRYLKKLPVG